MKSKRIDLHIGDVEDMGDRFIAAWKAAEAGHAVTRDHVTFLSLESFVSILSPKRLALLKALRASGASSVRALAAHLARDYKSVHQDVALLADAGLITRQARDRVAVTWDRVRAEMDLRAA